MRLVWTLLALSTVVMTLRIWTKVRKTHRLYYDDGVMVVALVSTLPPSERDDELTQYTVARLRTGYRKCKVIKLSPFKRHAAFQATHRENR